MTNWKCNHCGTSEYFIGIQYAHATLNKGLRNAPVKHEVCLQCGTINRSFIEKPDKFKKFKEE